VAILSLSHFHKVSRAEGPKTQIRRILTLGDRAEGLSDVGFPAFVYPEPYLTVG
jgi:hypothetical protein